MINVLFTQILKIRNELSSQAFLANSLAVTAAGELSDDVKGKSTQVDGIIVNTLTIQQMIIDNPELLIHINDITIENTDGITVMKFVDSATSLSFATADLANHLSDTIPGTAYTVQDIVTEYGQEFINSTTNQISSFSIQELTDNLDKNIKGTSYKVSDILSSSSQTGDLYAALASVTQKFSYANRVSIDTLNNIIDHISTANSVNYDINDLKTYLLSVSDNDGYITSRAWLTSLSTWIKSCKNGADHGSTELDNTAPDVLSGLYNIVVSVVSTFMDVVLTAFAAVFGVIGRLLSTLFSTLFSSLSNYFSETGVINPDCPNSFSKGVIISKEMVSMEGTSLYQYTKDGYNINYSDLPTAGFFFWQGAVQNSIRMNCYLKPSISPETAVIFFENIIASRLSEGYTVGINVYNQWYSISRDVPFYNEDGNDYSPTYVLSDEEELLVSNDVNYYAVCLLVSEFMRFYSTCPLRVPNENHDNWVHNTLTYNGVTGYWDNVNIPLTVRIINAGWNIICNLKNHNTYYDSHLDNEKCQELVADYVKYLYSNREDVSDPNWIWYFNSTYHNVVCGATNPLFVYNDTDSGSNSRYPGGQSFSMVYDTSTHQSAVALGGFTDPVGNLYDADSLPSNFLVSWRSMDDDSLVKVLVISALVATAAAVVFTKVSKAVRLKKIKKTTLRTNKIADLRAAVDADPNNKELMDKYTHEVDKFNRMGKIFGWGSYDAANNWIDTSTSGSSVADPINNIIDVAAKTKSLKQDMSDSFDQLTNDDDNGLVDRVDLKVTLMQDAITGLSYNIERRFDALDNLVHDLIALIK